MYSGKKTEQKRYTLNIYLNKYEKVEEKEEESSRTKIIQFLWMEKIDKNKMFHLLYDTVYATTAMVTE